jgi:hypothetical protein
MISSSAKPGAPTPQERLALSRLQIMQTLQSQNPASDPAGTRTGSDHDAAGSDGWRHLEQQELRVDGLSGVWRIGRHALKAWWRTHPAHLALDVAQPLLGQYASTHPVKLLAIAASLGAAVVVARPWRLVSATGLLVAALKSTQVSAVVSALMHANRSETPARHPTQGSEHTAPP